MSPEHWQQIVRLFDEVREREPQEQAAFLDAACANDADLRREVEALLAANDQAGDFLVVPALEIEARKVAATQAALMTGQRIAHFEVLAPLGAGAMGEVYLARDVRLNRKVALKLLPAHFTQEEARLRRFGRESRAASLLNHPNIITVFDIGQEATPEGLRHYIATEYVEGITLREHLAQGPLRLEEALAVARQIAAALEATHAAGIVHRDIKPENVMVRPDGVVKVLDFGIAKLMEKSGDERTPAPPQPSTAHGTVIGTPGYMSPEQARGLAVDTRTDLFSLGIVLYEMIAGQPPFRGATPADTVVTLLEQEPARLSGHNPGVSSDLEKLVGKALAKDRGERYGTVAELLRELEACQPAGTKLQIIWRKITARPVFWLWSLTGKHTTPARKDHYHRLLAFCLSGGIIIAALGWWLYRNSRQPEIWAEPSQLHLARFVSKQIGVGSGLSRPVFSPDGKEVAYSLGEERGKTHVWVKSIARELETKLTDGPALDLEPIWSPDGKKLAFLSYRAGQRDLWVVERARPPAAEPALLKKLDFNNSRLVAWATDQQREWIYLEAQDNLFAIDPVSTELRQLTQREKRDRDTGFSLSPDFSQVAYLDKIKNDYCLMLQSLRSAEATSLLCGPSTNRTLIWFPDGRKIAFLSNRTGTDQVYILWLDDRRIEQVTFSNDGYESLALSPDGNRILAKAKVETGGIYAWDFDKQAEGQYFSARGSQVLPEVSPSGDQMIFQSVSASPDSEATIFSKPAVPGEPAARLTAGFRGRWSPSGETLAFLRGPANNAELWYINLQDQTEARLASGLFTAGYQSRPYNLDYAEYCWSPDGASLVYNSREPDKVSNLWQVTAKGVPPVKLTNNSNQFTLLYSPRWSPAGNKLAYLAQSRPAETQQPNRWRLHLLAEQESSLLLEREAPLRILGWTAAGQELLVAAGPMPGATPGKEIELLRVTVNERQARGIGKVQTDYVASLTLSRDGRQLALVARRSGRDHLELVFPDNGAVKMLTNSSDAGTRFGSLSWAADGRRLFYSKQELWQEMLLITKKTAG